MKNLTRLVSMLLVFTLLITLPLGLSALAADKEVLRVAWWGNTNRDKLYFAINDLFMAQNPDVEIVTESPAWADYWVSMATAYASGSAPDVVQFQSNQIGEYCSKDVLLPLDDYVASGTINLADWNKGYAYTGKYQDKLYMISLGLTAQGMLINKTMVEKYGMTVWGENEDITWPEFNAFLTELQSKLPEDTYSCMDFYNNNDLTWVWIRQHSPIGTEWVDAEGKFAPTEAMLTGWYDLANNLRASGAIAKAAWTQEWAARSWQEGPLAMGKVAVFFANANQYKMFQNGIEDDIVLRRVPTNPDGPNAYGDLLITSSFGISKTAKNPDLAARYIDFFANNLEAQKIFKMELGVVGNQAIQAELNKDADPSDVIAANYLSLVSSNAPAFIPKAPGVWAVQNEIQSASLTVAEGAMTSQQAAQYIIGVANDMIEENK